MSKREFRIQLRKILLNSERKRYSVNFYRFIVLGIAALFITTMISISVSNTLVFLTFAIPLVCFWKAIDYRQMSNERDEQVRALTVNEINDVIKKGQTSPKDEKEAAAN